MNPSLLASVVRIETAPDENGSYGTGTGFVVTNTEDATGEDFLITNKHMISDFNVVDQDIVNYRPYLNVYFYRSGDPSGFSFRKTKINILNAQSVLDKAHVHLHPNPAIDLVAIDVTDVMRDASEHTHQEALPVNFCLPFDRIKSFLTEIGEPVIALGYPLGIHSNRNDYPLAKNLYLASSPGEEVDIPYKANDRTGKTRDFDFSGKFLIVDGLIVPGNSGGPVMLVGGMRWTLNPTTHVPEYTSTTMKNYVIGVVVGNLGQSGLTVVLSADYIFDLVPTNKTSTPLSKK